MQYIDEEELDTMMQNGETFILCCSAVWCAPCKSYNKVLESVVAENDAPKVVKFDIDEQPEIAQRYKIRSVPTTLVFKNGQVDKIVAGSMSKEKVLELLK